MAAILLVHAGLLAWSATRHSPTFNEIGHVPAGLSHWHFRLFHLYRVNPPLPRMVATLPLLAIPPATDWSNYGLSDFSREEIPMGVRFAQANGPATFRYFAIARWALIPFSFAGAFVCYLWAKALWGKASGLMALSIWCFSPMILGHAPLVMPDVPAAATGLAASFSYWNWLRRPTWLGTLQAGVLLGIALLCKTSLLVLVVIWIFLWLLTRSPAARRSRASFWSCATSEGGMLLTMMLVSVYVINLGYAFTGSLEPLRSFRFQSRLLGGEPLQAPPAAGNRWAETRLANLPVPLPRDFLLGIDQQRTDFEKGDRCYLRGEWRQGGWWYFYLYAFAVKTPIGTLGLLLVASALALRRPTSPGSGLHPSNTTVSLPGWSDDACLLLPAAAMFVLVSSQTNYTNHFRYVLPAFPFLFVWISQVGELFRRGMSLAGRGVAGALFVGSVVSSLVAYPHEISYFNEVVGGPRHGHAHLLESNLAWGQDLLFLGDWMKKHPDVQSIGVATIGFIQPEVAGVVATLPPCGPGSAIKIRPGDDSDSRGPQPGWFAIDANFLHGTHWSTPAGNGLWQDIPVQGAGANFEYFRRIQPTDQVGGSFFIYHLTRDEANQLRGELGLAP